MELRRTDHHNRRPRRWPGVALVLLAAALAFAMIAWQQGSQRRALRAMPSAERQALLLRTLDNLRSVCEPPADAMRDYCTEQARFVLDFPECDGPCQRSANAQIARTQAVR